MDDTAIMQDNNNRFDDASAVSMSAASADPGGDSSTTPVGDSALLAHKLAAVGAAANSQPSTPQQQLQQQGAGDASSVTSEGSQDGSRQEAGSRPGRSVADVDAARQAALSALAGLDMTTTRANLDASKAAAATARANGDVALHQRKSSLRSVSCRQLGVSSGSSTPSSSSGQAPGIPLGAGKTVAFDDAAKRPAADSRPTAGLWRGPATLADGQQRRINRPPASRCISLPHIMQGRQGMTNRLAASYAQDAALQQQLQLLNGSTSMAQPYASFNQQLQNTGLGHSADTLALYQMKHQGISQQAPQTLLTQRSFAGAPGIAVDSSRLMVQQQQPQLQQLQPQQMQQLQPQQTHLMAGGWAPAAAAAPGPQAAGLMRWGSGQMQLPQGGGAAMAQAQAVAANAQLLGQLQAAQAQQGGDALWNAAPACNGLPVSSNHLQGVMMQPQAVAVSAGMSGISDLQKQQLMLLQMQAAGQGAAAGTLVAPARAAAGQAAVGSVVNGHNLLDQYQSVSWSVLAAAQGEAALRDQLLTELVLLLTLLHTLSNTLKGSMAHADALNDLSFLAAAARRHMATFSRLSQAGNIAVQLLALVTPLALKHLNSADVLEAGFLVLDTLALANRDVATVVTQQRVAALTSLGLQLPVEQLLQQQTLGLHWISNLASAVTRNKVVLESMASDGSSEAGGTVGSAGLGQGANMSGGGMPTGGLGLAAVSQPMMLGAQPGAAAAAPNTISPTRKTPLATYFEEAPGAGLGGVGAGLAPGAAAAGAANVRLRAGTPPGTRLGDPLMGEALQGLHLAGPAAAAPGSAIAPDAAADAGHLTLGELGQLTAGSHHGSGPVTLQLGSHGTYSPLGGGASLFGDSTLLAPRAPSSSGPSSTGATGLVGV